MQAQAISSPHMVISLKDPLNMVSPTAKVRMLSVLVTIKGHMKLFQVVTNVKIDRVAIAGAAHGSAILKKVWNSLHPSNFEASSNSFEKFRKYCLIINTPKPPKIAGTINA